MKALLWCEEQSWLKKKEKKKKNLRPPGSGYPGSCKQSAIKKNHTRIFEKKTLYVFFFAFFHNQMNTFDLFLDPLFPWWAGVKSNIALQAVQVYGSA